MKITPLHVLVFATSYGCVSVFTRSALDEGAGSTTILLMRGLGSAVLLWIGLLLARMEWRLPPRERNRSLAFGFLLAAGNFCMVEAVRDIPVPIAVLILYTFPILTSLASAMLGREPLTTRMLVALVMAFAGLAIIVQARIDEYTMKGILLSFGASVMFSTVLVLQSIVFKDGDPLRRTLHMLATVAVVMIIACAWSGGPQFPSSLYGLTTLFAIPATYVLGITGLFMAARAIGPARTSLYMNFEPVAAAILAALILDQALTPVQIGGAAIVLFALLVARGLPPTPPVPDPAPTGKVN
ncbi:MAG: hypothetical protein EXR39_17760 [Betaproteobacteria bacterium]|nr:hypothetical protein [Betaproteobacteria bacterium]